MKARRRKVFVSPQTQFNADINITPMVDVVLVLLIIFMVVTPLLEKDVPVALPKTEEVQTPQEVPAQQVVVNLTADGALTVNAEPVPSPEAYESRLRGLMASRGINERVVFFTAADDASYRALVQALDGARRAGAEVLGVATDP